jgi:hypothetical protein
MRTRTNVTPRLRTVEEEVEEEQGLVEEQVVVNSNSKNTNCILSVSWNALEVSGCLIPLPRVKPALA